MECILYDKTYKHVKHINIIVQMKKKSVRLDNCNALLAGCPAVINKINWFKMLQQKLLPNPKCHLIISVWSEQFKQHFQSWLFLNVTSEADVIERWRSSKLDWTNHKHNLYECNYGNTLLEGVCIRLTWHLHNHDMTHVMNMKEVLCMFMTTVIKCHSLSYVIFNAKMTLFDLTLTYPYPITKTSQRMSSLH